MDEPALREGLPLKRARWESYLSWAVRAFRLSTVVADPSTQIVTHLCYSEFADILPVSILVHPAVHDFLTAGMTAELQSIRRSNGAPWLYNISVKSTSRKLVTTWRLQTDGLCLPCHVCLLIRLGCECNSRYAGAHHACHSPSNV